jgi:hypothetical protein
MSGKYVVVYNVVDIARGHSPEKTLRDYIKDLILADSGQLWSLMEPYFVPPGKEGRRDYDHAEAVGHLKRYSRSHAKETKMPDPLDNLNTAALVPHVLKVLGMIGFVVNRGKIIGTKQEIEDLPLEPESDESSEESDDFRMAA